jgi:hypothetical protein
MGSAGCQRDSCELDLAFRTGRSRTRAVCGLVHRFVTPIGFKHPIAQFEFIEGCYNSHRRHSALDYSFTINYEEIQQTESLAASPNTVDPKRGDSTVARG